jgi:hypothetical protein
MRVEFWLAMTLLIPVTACDAKELSAAEGPEAPFRGRFLEIYGSNNAGELVARRSHRGASVLTEVVLLRSPGQVMDRGRSVHVVGFDVVADCRDQSYVLTGQNNYDSNGELMSSMEFDSPISMRNGPYIDLSRELCGASPPDTIDFISIEDFSNQAAGRRATVLLLKDPEVVDRSDR